MPAASWLLSFLIAVCHICGCHGFSNITRLNPLVIKGYKFFDSEIGESVVIRGIDYYPRPNDGPFNTNSVDFFTDEFRHVWERDLFYLKKLGVNAVRLYSVDPDKSHDGFMCALARAGIYAIVSLVSDCPLCAVTRDQAPLCYPPELKQRGQAVIVAFAKYSNVLGFSAGNEVNHFAPSNQPEWNAPCQKKFLRDMRAFIQKCPSMRNIPVGLVAADSMRTENALYYNCQSNPHDPLENAEWYGLNTYIFCNGNATKFEEAQGFVELQSNFASYGYSIPVLLTEFGCLSSSFPTIDGYEGQRSFSQARWLWEEPLVRDQFAGGFMFEYSIEKENAQAESEYPFNKFGSQNYGVGYFQPKDCDDISVPCSYKTLPSFSYLRDAYDTAKSNFTRYAMDSFQIDANRTGRTSCPLQFPKLSSFAWQADSTRDLRCPRPQDSNFTCPNYWVVHHDEKEGPQINWKSLLLTLAWVGLIAFVLGCALGRCIVIRSKSVLGGPALPTLDETKPSQSFDTAEEEMSLPSDIGIVASLPYKGDYYMSEESSSSLWYSDYSDESSCLIQKSDPNEKFYDAVKHDNFWSRGW